jgi:hypothetical protein
MAKHSVMELYMGPWPYTSLSYKMNMYTHHTEVRTGCDEQKNHCSCQESNLSHPSLHSILLLVANGHHNCIKCTNADARLRTPDDGQKGCLKHVVVIPIKLEFGASVGFIHKECVKYVDRNSFLQNGFVTSSLEVAVL